jgi:hypothetical protein
MLTLPDGVLAVPALDDGRPAPPAAVYPVAVYPVAVYLVAVQPRPGVPFGFNGNP